MVNDLLYMFYYIDINVTENSGFFFNRNLNDFIVLHGLNNNGYCEFKIVLLFLIVVGRSFHFTGLKLCQAVVL